MLKKRSGKNLIRFFYHLLVVIAMAFPLFYSALDYGTNQIRQFQQNENIINVDDINKLSVHNDFIYLNDLGSLLSNLAITSIRNSKIGGVLLVTYNSYVHPCYLEFENTSYFNSSVLCFIQQNNTTVGRINFSAGTLGNLVAPITLIDPIINSSFTITDVSNVTLTAVSIKLTYIENDVVNLFYQDILNYDYPITFDYSFDISMEKVNSMLDYQFLNFDYLSIIGSPTGVIWDFININIQWVLTCAVISFAPYVLLCFYYLAIGLLDKFINKGEDL